MSLLVLSLAPMFSCIQLAVFPFLRKEMNLQKVTRHI